MADGGSRRLNEFGTRGKGLLMDRRFRIARGCLAALVVLAGLASAGHGQTRGTDFAKMPVGCLKHVKIEDVNRGLTYVIEVYAGRQGRFHVVQVFPGPARAGTFDASQRLWTSYHNDDGLLVRRERANGVVEKFHPHECARVSGRCTVTRSSSRGATQRLEAKTSRRGNRMHFSDVKVNGWVEGGYDFTFGPFGDIVASKEPGRRVELIRYENCGV